MSKEVDKTPQERKLEAKIKELEKALEQERLRTLALNTMINIAETGFKNFNKKKVWNQTVTELRTMNQGFKVEALCGLFG